MTKGLLEKIRVISVIVRDEQSIQIIPAYDSEQQFLRHHSGVTQKNKKTVFEALA